MHAVARPSALARARTHTRGCWHATRRRRWAHRSIRGCGCCTHAHHTRAPGHTHLVVGIVVRVGVARIVPGVAHEHAYTCTHVRRSRLAACAIGASPFTPPTRMSPQGTAQPQKKVCAQRRHYTPGRLGERNVRSKFCFILLLRQQHVGGHGDTGAVICRAYGCAAVSASPGPVCPIIVIQAKQACHTNLAGFLPSIAPSPHLPHEHCYAHLPEESYRRLCTRSLLKPS